jgi:hypothetical protein
MKYGEAIEAIKSLENGNDLASAILEEVQKKGQAEAGLRARLKAYDGFDVEKVTSLFESLKASGVDPDGDVQSQLASLADSKTQLTDADKTIKVLQTKVDGLAKQYAEESARRQQIEEAGKKAKLRAELSPAFLKDVVASKTLLELHVERGDFVLTEDGAVAYKRGDEVISQNVVAEYLKDHPENAKTNQAGGVGSGARGGSTQNKPTITLKEFNKMDGREAAEFLKENPKGVVDD